MTILAAGNLAAITLMMAMATALLLHRSKLALLFSLLFFLLAVYLSLSVMDYASIHPWFSFFMARLSSLVPAAIWLVAFCLFRDNERIPLWIWPIIVGYVGLRALGVALLNLQVIGNSLPFYVTFIVIPQLLMIGLAGHAICMAIAGFRDDLMENRRKFRVIFVTATSIYILLTRIRTWIVYNGVVEGVRSDEVVLPVLDHLMMIYALVLACAFFMTSFGVNAPLNKLLQKAVTRVPLADFKKKKVIDADQQILRKIHQKMAVDQQFVQADLTVDRFSRELNVHPHKLRRVITTYFRFNNFNQFLNHFRVHEAARKLLTSAQPITAIAYDVGFSSISAFNTAFKATHGVTPSQYRMNPPSPPLESKDEVNTAAEGLTKAV